MSVAAENTYETFPCNGLCLTDWAWDTVVQIVGALWVDGEPNGQTNLPEEFKALAIR